MAPSSSLNVLILGGWDISLQFHELVNVTAMDTEVCSNTARFAHVHGSELSIPDHPEYCGLMHVHDARNLNDGIGFFCHN